MNSRKVSLLVYLAASVSLCGLVSPSASATPSDLLQYLNPAQKKQSYLNQSQDRVIKKKSFKAVDVNGAQAIPNKENGLFVEVPTTDLADEAKLTDILSDQRVSGISVVLPWRQLEPDETKYDWQSIDKLLDLCQKNNKSMILRVSTSGLDATADQSDTPKWVFAAGAKSITYKGADGQDHQMPIYWDATYLARWSNFVHALADRYDKNPGIHSIGITGGGARGGTAIVPTPDKTQADAIEQTLKAEFGMNQHQIVEHWKYVADLFPNAFKTARLNFDADAPTASRAGQDMLDEISDYLIYRYGERVYMTRQNVDSAKHGFDQYRVLLKFRPDTLTGYQLTSAFPATDLKVLLKNSLDDGISFAEIPASMLQDKDPAVADALEQLRAKLGYQVVSEKVTLPSDIKSGEPLKAGFTFLNIGSAAPMRPSRQFDKDVATSYKVQLELRDASGKPVVQSLHTPAVPTNKWTAGQPISWEQELKMPAKLKPGEYSVWLSLVDADTKRKLQILNQPSSEKTAPGTEFSVGKIQVSSD